jgi:predicted nucleotidyltransferase
VTCDRDSLLDAIVVAAREMDAVLALWECGSASFGRTDAYSDIDLEAIVKPDQVQPVAEAMKAALSRVAEIAHEYRQVTYHGSCQFFWQFERVSPFCFIDIVLIEQKDEAHQVDRSIHGAPIIHFDKCGCIAVIEEGLEARRARVHKGVEAIAAMQDLHPLLVDKHIRRGHALHAYGDYQRFMVRPLIELLRLKHCPERSSFQTTYITWDLPREVLERLESLVMVSGLEEMAENLPAISAWIRALIGELRENPESIAREHRRGTGAND